MLLANQVIYTSVPELNPLSATEFALSNFDANASVGAGFSRRLQEAQTGRHKWRHGGNSFRVLVLAPASCFREACPLCRHRARTRAGSISTTTSDRRPGSR